MPEMSHLQARPLVLHDDNGDGIIGTTLLLHAERAPKGYKQEAGPTLHHTHANECMFEYVYKGGGEGLDEPVTGVE